MINFKRILKEKNISILTASKIMRVPYASLYSIVNGETRLEDCKFSTIMKISNFFNISLEDLVLPDESFQDFRNELHHELVKSDIQCHQNLANNNLVERYLLHDEYVKAIYIVALMDYLEHKYKLPRSKVVEKYHNYKLNTPFDLRSSVYESDDYIPEFYARNIYEGDLYDAI